MAFSTISRDPKANPRSRRALDQLKALLNVAVVTLDSSITQTGNTAATETTLFSYVLPSNELSNMDSIEFSAAGRFAATASVDKRIKVKFGSTTIYDSGALAITTAESWVLRGTVTRTGSATQKCDVILATSSTTLAAEGIYATASETLSSSVTLTVTGYGTNASDVVGERFKVLHQPG